jgi:signal transduction histidine kinase
VATSEQDLEERVLVGERRLKILGALSARMAAARTPDEVCALAAAVLDGARADIAFAKLYLLDAMNDPPRPVASSGDPLVASTIVELPLSRGVALPAAHLVVGIDARRPRDDAGRDFVHLVGDLIAAALQNARAYADERARAEELGELDRVKTEFFANISHELRTPLTLLLGPADELLADREAPLSDAQRTQVNLIHQNARRLLKLVSSVLDVSRLEAGRMRASFVPTDLPRLTAELTSVFGSAVQKAGLRYLIDCPPLANAAYVDREMWEKIVLNLVSNAFKHTFEGCIVVTLREHAEAFELTVEDTGIGIPPDELPHIFERFHRVRGAQARSHEGSGIGLSLVHELVRLHGGTIEVDSEPARGTCFTVTLPAGSAHLPREAIGAPAPDDYRQHRDASADEARQWLHLADGDPAAPVPTPAIAAQLVPRDLRVHVVDDSAELRAYVAGLLSPHCTVETAADGAVALERALASPPDLVLSDVVMPNLDGYGLLRALRSDPRTETTPVVMLAARPSDGPAPDDLGATPDDYLAKPFTARDLIGRVRTHALLARARREWAARLKAVHVARNATLAGMSHELRTSLNAIIGFAEIVHDGMVTPDQPEFREFLSHILTGARQLLGLVNDALDLSRVETGTIDFVPARVDVGTLVREVVLSIEAKAQAADVRIETEIEPALGEVVADPRRLKQVLYNCLSNALHATPRRGRVTVRARSENASAWRLEVVDSGTGGGASPDNLWLSLTRCLVEAQGGSVGIERRAGDGSTLHAVLPRDTSRTRTSPP